MHKESPNYSESTLKLIEHIDTLDHGKHYLRDFFKDLHSLEVAVQEISEYYSPEKPLSAENPFCDFLTEDGTRIAMMHQSVSQSGIPDIQVIKDFIMTPSRLVKDKVITEEFSAWLQDLIKRGSNVVFCGRTYTGKTSLLEAFTHTYVDSSDFRSLDRDVCFAYRHQEIHLMNKSISKIHAGEQNHEKIIKPLVSLGKDVIILDDVHILLSLLSNKLPHTQVLAALHNNSGENFRVDYGDPKVEEVAEPLVSVYIEKDEDSCTRRVTHVRLISKNSIITLWKTDNFGVLRKTAEMNRNLRRTLEARESAGKKSSSTSSTQEEATEGLELLAISPQEAKEVIQALDTLKTFFGKFGKEQMPAFPAPTDYGKKMYPYANYSYGYTAE